jgi:hypothetical protein
MEQFMVQAEKPRGPNYQCLYLIDWLCGVPEPQAQVLHYDISGPAANLVQGRPGLVSQTDTLPVDSACSGNSPISIIIFVSRRCKGTEEFPNERVLRRIFALRYCSYVSSIITLCHPH